MLLGTWSQAHAYDRFRRYGDQALKPGLQISRMDRKHMVANTFFKLFTDALVFK